MVANSVVIFKHLLYVVFIYIRLVRINLITVLKVYQSFNCEKNHNSISLVLTRNYYHHSSVVSILRGVELNIIRPNLKTTSWSRSLKRNSLFVQTIILCKLVNTN